MKRISLTRLFQCPALLPWRIAPGLAFLLLPFLQPLQAQKTWDFMLAPYLWFAGIEGDVSTVPGLPVAPIEVSPGEALEDTEVSLMLVFVANRGRHGISADFFYSDVQSDEELAPQLGLVLKSTSKSTVGSLCYQYNLIEGELQLFAGLRYWNIDTELSFSGGAGFLDGQQVRHSEDWIDPVFGVRGRHDFGESRFFVSGILAGGGSVFGSDYFYDLSGTVGYRWTPAIATTFGYRLYDLKYEEDEFFYDVRQAGWLVALLWNF